MGFRFQINFPIIFSVIGQNLSSPYNGYYIQDPLLVQSLRPKKKH